MNKELLLLLVVSITILTGCIENERPIIVDKGEIYNVEILDIQYDYDVDTHDVTILTTNESIIILHNIEKVPYGNVTMKVEPNYSNRNEYNLLWVKAIE